MKAICIGVTKGQRRAWAFPPENRVPLFAGKSMVQRHRLVYQAMGELMQTDIHALTIDAAAPVGA
jgi:hypothetical protein